MSPLHHTILSEGYKSAPKDPCADHGNDRGTDCGAHRPATNARLSQKDEHIVKTDPGFHGRCVERRASPPSRTRNRSLIDGSTSSAMVALAEDHP
jgi:hypothetical protein